MDAQCIFMVGLSFYYSRNVLFFLPFSFFYRDTCEKIRLEANRWDFFLVAWSSQEGGKVRNYQQGRGGSWYLYSVSFIPEWIQSGLSGPTHTRLPFDNVIWKIRDCRFRLLTLQYWEAACLGNFKYRNLGLAVKKALELKMTLNACKHDAISELVFKMSPCLFSHNHSGTSEVKIFMALFIFFTVGSLKHEIDLRCQSMSKITLTSVM